MGEVLRVNGFKVVIFSDDHNPPHVHIRKGGFEVKIDISGEHAKLILGEGKSRRAADQKLRKQAMKIADDNLKKLMEEWRRIDAERS